MVILNGAMNERTITIENRPNYGRDAWYVTSGHAEAVRKLTGRKTVDMRDVNALEALGFRVVVGARGEIPAREMITA